MRLEIRDLVLSTERHGQRRDLVRGLDLDVEPGRVTAMIGASGSGKSLTAMAIQDVLPPGVTRRGTVVVREGQETRPVRRGRDVATILQNPRSAFNPLRTLRAHAEETARAIGADIRRFEVLLGEVGLEAGGVLDLYAFQMSGGMLQRAMIALALFSSAPFIVADEPTTDLDLVVQARILDLFAGLIRERGLGVLFVTHDMGVVVRLAETVHVVEAGRIVESGPVERLFAAPRHPATMRLVSAHLALYPEDAGA